MSVTVEFLGIVRHRSGREFLEVEAETLGQLLQRVGEEIPVLNESCLENGCLKPGYLASLDGQRFTTDPATALAPGDRVILLSADAGG
jgi:molybdopterin converting factor small subunit